MIQNKNLNVARIRELMNQGFKALKAPKGSRQAVLVIGDTGVGKSTIISLLAGVKLIVKHNGLNTIIDSADSQTKVKIGHQKYSQTTVPTKIVIDDIDFFDCSGFRDNRGDQFEISNSFFLQRLFYLYEKVKILLIIDENYVTQARLDKLPKLIHSLGEAFGSIKSIQDGVVLLINKAKINRNIKDYSAEIQRLTQLKGEKPLFNSDEKAFLSFLIQNKRLIIFKQADESQAGKQLNISSAQIIGPIKSSSFIKSKKIKNIISESAKLSIRDYADQLLAEGQQKFDDFIRKIKLQFSKQKGIVKTVEQTQEIWFNVQKFVEGLKKCDQNGISQYLKASIPNLNDGSIGKDISSILFLRQIYEKSNTYFTILKHKLISQLTLYRSQINDQLIYLKKQQQQFLQLKNKQLELQNKLKVEQEERNKIKRQSQQYQTAIKNKQKDLQVFKIDKEKQIQTLKTLFSTERKNAQRLLSERQEQLKSYRKDQSIKVQELNQRISAQQKLINTLKKTQTQTKNYLERVQEQKQLINKDFQSMRIKFQKLKIDYQSSLHDIDQLNFENESLKLEIQNLENVSVAQSSKSMASKSSKYPDVFCPHFKNGGKCKHCIRKWKQSLKMNNSQV